MNLDPARTVAELVLEAPQAMSVFDRFGIDYCCGGGKSLLEACGIARVNPNDVLESLNGVAETESGTQPNFHSASLAELITYIVNTHHHFTKAEIARLPMMLDKLCSVHGQTHPELMQVRALFRQLSADLEPHMLKEERVLFPYIVEMEAASMQSRPRPRPPFGTVLNPIRMMMMEHDVAGSLLKEIRAASYNYQLPPDACTSYRAAYHALEAIEKDLHQHIHLENNLLFPRAAFMEDQA